MIVAQGPSMLTKNPGTQIHFQKDYEIRVQQNLRFMYENILLEGITLQH